jgi:hypothetical protein
MKASLYFAVLLSAALGVACGDDDESSRSGAGGEAGSGGESGEPGDGGEPPTSSGGEGGDTPTPGRGGEPASGGEGGAPVETAAWYECQVSDQAFVRRAVLGVLGRRPYSQAEVNLYTDLIEAVDEADGVTAEEKHGPPGSVLRRSRKLVLEALFQKPEYAPRWEELYRDFIRVQRIEEQFNGPCFATPLNEDPAAAASYVRDEPVDADGAEIGPFSMYDVVKGSIAIDDVTPIYTANLFAMLTKTYLGANALPVALELTRRRDFGAWFDAVYLHRDVVCLGCHNSEFSVTQSANPLTNRHFPVPALLEKSVFGSSTGPATLAGYQGDDRMHAALRFNGFVNDCDPTPYTQAEAEEYWYNPGCSTPEESVHFCLSEAVCESEFLARGQSTPWGMTPDCGRFVAPDAVKVDIAGVEAKFGSVTGVRASAWKLSAALRRGFETLREEGLGAGADGEVGDPDKAFAYLVALNVAEKVWLEIVGTPLTIPTRFPRNAAARDELLHLTDAFVASGFSNQALLEAVFASPYVNLASPEAGCGDVAYAAPAVFDPWVIAEEDESKRKNSAADGVVSLTSRAATSALYAALGWSVPERAAFPDLYYADPEDPLLSFLETERQFQGEVGFYLKNSEPGFRGFDFQARLGWENRFATCQKLPEIAGDDFIDELVASVNVEGQATVGDLVVALKDRLLGRAVVAPGAEQAALEAMLGAPLDSDASLLPEAGARLREICGVFASSPQFLLNGIPSADGDAVPKLTPEAADYAALCAELAGVALHGVSISCHDGEPLGIESN